MQNAARGKEPPFVETPPDVCPKSRTDLQGVD